MHIDTAAAPPAETEDRNPLPESAPCLHCKLIFRPTRQRPDFCCSGCQFVYRLINEQGLDDYYDLQDGRAQPVKGTVFQKRDYSWLTDLAKKAEEQSAVANLVLDLQGISCVGCVWLIEELFRRKNGAISAQVNSALGQVRFQWSPGEIDFADFARELQSFGYLLAPAAKQETRENRESRQLIRRIGIAAALSMNCMLFTIPFYLGMGDEFEYASLFALLVFCFATASVLVGGSYFFRRSWNSLRRGIIHIDLPISLGILAAYSGSIYAWIHNDLSFFYFDFVSMFTFLMLVGRWLQQVAIERNRNYLLGMKNQQQQVSLLTPDGTSRKIEITEIVEGMQFRVSPGQFIPVRSELVSETATVGLDWISGESEAHDHRRGNRILAGAVNLGGDDLELIARENWSESLLASLLATDPRETPRNHLLERIIKIYLITVLAVGAVGWSAWYFGSGDSFLALQVLISVLVVSCPCAIGVAWPLTDELAVSLLRKRGVFVRDQSLWHRLAKVRKVIFDKTGTLTMENLTLRNPEALHNLNETERGILLHLTESNLHPVSRCLREHLLAEGFDQKPEEIASLPVREILGLGVEMETEAGSWRLARPSRDDDPASSNRILSRPETSKKDSLFTLNRKILAAFSLAEEIRPDAAEEIALLQNSGCETYILSGDRQEKVDAMARALDLPSENCLGEMSPTAKAEWARKIDADDTLMIGDGANDSLAFDQTWCRGTPAIDRGLLEEKADFYFLGRGLNGIRQLFEAAENRRRILKWVFGFTICYNIVVVSVSLAGFMNPIVAAIVMPLTSLFLISSVVAQTKWRERRLEERKAPSSFARTASEKQVEEPAISL